MRIALITPWPPQATGIADYAYDLAKGLIEAGHEVCAITEATEPRPLPGIEFIHPSQATDELMQGFDRLAYQMGNNSRFHLYMISMLIRHPGVVHVHDTMLHHILAWVLYDQGDPSLYQAVLAKWYGPAVERLSLEVIRTQQRGLWETPLVMDYPLFEEVLQHATSCIVHSRFSKSKIQRVFPGMDVTLMPQLYEVTDTQPFPFADKRFHVGLFGGVDANKRIEVVLKSMSNLVAKGLPVDLHIAGSISKDCEFIHGMIDALGLRQAVHLHGRLAHDAFLSLLHSVDLCVALRYPTMGETSAIVMRTMQAGVPVIVSDVGWYSELPDFVQKIEPNTLGEVQALADQIQALASSPEAHQSARTQLQAYLRSDLDYSGSLKAYVQALH